ncbi:MAG: hypothetical protein ACRD0P_36265, partial [Stackebrandtia sp.]
MFDVFDVRSDHGRVYRALVSAPRSTVTSLAARTRLTDSAIRDSLVELQRVDAVVALDPAKELWEARRPDLVTAEAMRQFGDWRARHLDSEAQLNEANRYSRIEDTSAIN